MKHKKIVIVIKWWWIALLFFILLASLSYISQATDYSRIGNYTLADWGGAPSIDGTNATEGSSIETKGYTVTNGAATYQSAFNISYYQPYTLTTGESGDQKWHYNGAINYKLCCNMVAKDEDDASLYHVFGFIESNDDFHGAFIQSNNADWIFGWNAGGNTQTFTGYNPSNNWANFTVCYQPSTQWAVKFTNGSWFNTTTNVEASLPDTFGVISINTGRTILGMWACWNGTYENNPSFVFGELPDTEKPNATLIYPINENLNSKLYINGNATDNTNITRIITNDTVFNITTSNTIFSKKMNWNITNSSTILDKTYNIIITFFDNASNNATLFVNFTIDTVNPTINILSPTNHQIISNSSMLFKLYCYDLNLYGYQFKIYNDTNVIYYNETFNLGVTNYTFVTLVNISNLSDGTYDINANCLDGHTSTAINNIPITKTTDSLTIGDFTINPLIKPDSFEYKKEYDRYTYSFIYPTITTYQVRVTSKQSIVKVLNSNYKGHYITGNHYWFDTEPYKPVSEEYINDNEIMLSFNGDKFIFNSVGVLNNVSQHIDFVKTTSEATNETTTAETIVDVGNKFVSITVVCIFLIIHFIILILGFTFRVSEMVFISGILGILVSFIGIALLINMIGNLGLLFFVSYIFVCGTFMFISYSKND